MNLTDVLREYDSKLRLHEEFTRVLESLVRQILQDRNIAIHSILARTKERASFERKITKKKGKYQSASDVTDVVGVRVITYFSNDVDHVAEALAEELIVDPSHSVDKRQLLETDRFGYISLHSVISLPSSRVSLYEYRRYAGLKAEIQVRSILQHAWAEIEHDLGYKTVAEVPKHIRRQFSRLAGLLEIADDEFVSIRRALRTYEAQVPARIKDQPDAVALDKASLRVFIMSSELVADLDQRIAGLSGGRILPIDAIDFQDHLSGLRVLGIHSVGDLDYLLRTSRERILRLAADWLREPVGDVTGLICLRYLAYTVLNEKAAPDLAREYLRASGMEPGRIDGYAELIVSYKLPE